MGTPAKISVEESGKASPMMTIYSLQKLKELVEEHGLRMGFKRLSDGTSVVDIFDPVEGRPHVVLTVLHAST